jgi:hypothetical protein
MSFHGVFLGSQHEMWSKQHNGKVSLLLSDVEIIKMALSDLYYQEIKRGAVSQSLQEGWLFAIIEASV